MIKDCLKGTVAETVLQIGIIPEDKYITLLNHASIICLNTSLPPPLFLTLEGNLHWFVHHVHHKAVLIAWCNLVKVVPHRNITGELSVIVKKKSIEPRIILQ